MSPFPRSLAGRGLRPALIAMFALACVLTLPLVTRALTTTPEISAKPDGVSTYMEIVGLRVVQGDNPLMLTITVGTFSSTPVSGATLHINLPPGFSMSPAATAVAMPTVTSSTPFNYQVNLSATGATSFAGLFNAYTSVDAFGKDYYIGYAPTNQTSLVVQSTSGSAFGCHPVRGNIVLPSAAVELGATVVVTEAYDFLNPTATPDPNATCPSGSTPETPTPETPTPETPTPETPTPETPTPETPTPETPTPETPGAPTVTPVPPAYLPWVSLPASTPQAVRRESLAAQDSSQVVTNPQGEYTGIHSANIDAFQLLEIVATGALTSTEYPGENILYSDGFFITFDVSELVDAGMPGVSFRIYHRKSQWLPGANANWMTLPVGSTYDEATKTVWGAGGEFGEYALGRN